MSHSGFATKVGYFFVGASLGAAVAMLFAPRSGKETREYLADRAGEGKDYLAGRGRELRRQAADAVDRGKTFVGRHKDRLAEALKTN
jgi:gas vesicle protein